MQLKFSFFQSLSDLILPANQTTTFIPMVHNTRVVHHFIIFHLSQRQEKFRYGNMVNLLFQQIYRISLTQKKPFFHVLPISNVWNNSIKMEFAYVSRYVESIKKYYIRWNTITHSLEMTIHQMYSLICINKDFSYGIWIAW